MAENMTIFFGGALLGACVTFLAMCFAFCAGQGERGEDEGGYFAYTRSRRGNKEEEEEMTEAVRCRSSRTDWGGERNEP